jgi:hypothetical protein
MSESRPDTPEPEWYGHAEPGPSDQQRPDLVALVVDRPNGTACTVYPPDVAEPYRTTTWITATGNSFVDAGQYR